MIIQYKSRINLLWTRYTSPRFLKQANNEIFGTSSKKVFSCEPFFGYEIESRECDRCGNSSNFISTIGVHFCMVFMEEHFLLGHMCTSFCLFLGSNSSITTHNRLHYLFIRLLKIPRESQNTGVDNLHDRFHRLHLLLIRIYYRN